jgi:hypothetical protein
MQQSQLLVPPYLSSVSSLAPWSAIMDLVALPQRGRNNIIVELMMTATIMINIDDNQYHHCKLRTLHYYLIIQNASLYLSII